MSGAVDIRIAAVEARNLIDLLDEFAEIVADPRAADDPGMSRLTPDAYPDDDAATAEFRQATRDHLIERRRADALAVRRTLEPVVTAAAGDLVAQRLALTAMQADAWMRTLAAMRLVVASRLGIQTADDHDVDDPRFAVYDWLGYRLELLVRAADDHDGDV